MPLWVYTIQEWILSPLVIVERREPAAPCSISGGRIIFCWCLILHGAVWVGASAAFGVCFFGARIWSLDALQAAFAARIWPTLRLLT